MLIDDEVMDQELECGKQNCKNLQMKSIWKFIFLIFHLEQVNGIKLNIECLVLFLKIGGENLFLIEQQL
jgi:hypothetical protein